MTHPPNHSAINKRSRQQHFSAVVADLGGTSVRMGLLDATFHLVHQHKVRLLPFDQRQSEDQFCHSLVTQLADFAEVAGLAPHSPFIVGFPGPIRDHREIAMAPTLGHAWKCQDLVCRLIERTHLSVHLLNDVSAAAYHYGRVLPDELILVVTISSGIGAKLYDRSRPRKVFDDFVISGEIGHKRVDHSADAPVCDCGRPGHLGAIASGRGIERAARRRAIVEATRFAASLAASKYKATANTLNNEDHLVPAARDGDAWVLEVVRDGLRPLAAELASAVRLIGLGRIVLMGGFAQAMGPCFVDLLTSEFRQACDLDQPSDVDHLFWAAPPGEEPGLLGAAAYAEELLCRD